MTPEMIAKALRDRKNLMFAERDDCNEVLEWMGFPKDDSKWGDELNIVADSLIDWWDPDNNVTGEFGAEDEYYESLDTPYICRNGDLPVIEPGTESTPKNDGSDEDPSGGDGF